ncbi:MAG: protoglobin domain-containing protein [Pirellulales bacterium]
MDATQLYSRYQDLQRYLNWNEADRQRVVQLQASVAPSFVGLIDDFYAEIQRHIETRRVLVGGDVQVARLKGTLLHWLRQLFSGRYDSEYVSRRWSVGLRHVEIGLDQQFTNAALGRMRTGLAQAALDAWSGDARELAAALVSLNKLLDLDLAIIEDAYQYEYLQRQKRAERLIAIGQMASGIAHELRNPLNVVRTSVFYLQNARRPTPEKQAEHLERIQRQVGVADGVITALSDFAKLPLPQFGPIAVGELIEETLTNVSASETVQIATQIDPSTPPIEGDARQLYVVFSNLIRNALDAMPEGGVVTIASAVAGERVLISVSDTGCGIGAEEVRRVFEPFYSTKVRGIGLGLAICRAIVENHGGEIRVTSQVGKGTTFVVALRIANV